MAEIAVDDDGGRDGAQPLHPVEAWRASAAEANRRNGILAEGLVQSDASARVNAEAELRPVDGHPHAGARG